MSSVFRDVRVLVGGGTLALAALVGMRIFGPKMVPFVVMAILATLLVSAAGGAAVDVLYRSLTR